MNVGRFGALSKPDDSSVVQKAKSSVSQVNSVNVEISVLLGRSVLPMNQLLRMGRGAVIPLDAAEHDEVWILANNHPVARGEIQISEDRIAICVTGPADVYDFMAGGIR